MPYIRQSDRPRIDKAVKVAVEQEVKPNGELNYFLYRLCLETVEPSYNSYKNFIAELTETCAEIRRRLLAPYEDERITENGDVKRDQR